MRDDRMQGSEQAAWHSMVCWHQSKWCFSKAWTWHMTWTHACTYIAIAAASLAISIVACLASDELVLLRQVFPTRWMCFLMYRRSNRGL